MSRDTTTRNRHRAAIAAHKPPCHLCGEPIDYSLKSPHPQSFEVDHVVALARGGSDTLANKRAAHRACNQAKAAGDDDVVLRRSGSLR